jgi:cellulose synthase/poly-beta-1,6-N-acetylglucosamine synthase-like glycosyltransferase
VADARGEIVMFSDANSLHDAAALKNLVRNFADPAVGYVTGKMVYVDESGSLIGSGCDAYMRYENVLRALETRAGSVVGVDGGVDAVRRSLYDPMAPDMLPDFVLPLRVAGKGFRVVYEESALLHEHALSDAGDESRMRVRVTLRSLHALWTMKRLFLPWVGGFFSFQLLVHKLLRYAVGHFQVLILLANAALAVGNPFYRALFVLQSAFYLMAFAGHLLSRIGKSVSMCRYPYYFCLLNACAVIASWKFLKGEKKAVWQPRKG